MPVIEPPKFADGNWNPFETAKSALSSMSNSRISGGRYGFKQASKLMDQHHSNELDRLTHAAGLQKELLTHEAGLTETAAASSHSRDLELHNAIYKSAQSGTQVNWRRGDVSADYTKKVKKEKIAAPVEEAPKAESQAGAGWSSTPTGATFLPIVAKPSASESTSGALVGRNEKGQAISLKPGGAPKASKPKKTAKAVPASTVGRDPKTGRAISLKKK